MFGRMQKNKESGLASQTEAAGVSIYCHCKNFGSSKEATFDTTKRSVGRFTRF
jgi:hypothetical protein